MSKKRARVGEFRASHGKVQRRGKKEGQRKKLSWKARRRGEGGDRTAQFTPDDLIASQHEMEKGRREGGGKSNRGTGGFRSILKRTI